MSWPIELVSTSDRFYFVVFLVRSHLFLLSFTPFLLPLSFPLLESLWSEQVRNDFKICHQLSNYARRDLTTTSKWYKSGKNKRNELVIVNML